ncbi:hypothetical protein Hanom_Chr12g01173921 [Helianthus anomalus]
MNISERTRPLFMFVHLTKRTKFHVCVRLFNKRTNIDELPAERFTNCSALLIFKAICLVVKQTIMLLFFILRMEEGVLFK